MNDARPRPTDRQKTLARRCIARAYVPPLGGSERLSSGGRGRASSAAACPSLLWAAERRHPSPRPTTRVRARPRGCWRGRGVAAGAPRRRARGTRGVRPVSGSRRAGGYRLSRPCSAKCPLVAPSPADVIELGHPCGPSLSPRCAWRRAPRCFAHRRPQLARATRVSPSPCLPGSHSGKGVHHRCRATRPLPC